MIVCCALRKSAYLQAREADPVKQSVRSMPILPATDLAASATFFTAKLGFDLAGHWTNDDGTPNFAIVQLGMLPFAYLRLIAMGLAMIGRLMFMSKTLMPLPIKFWAVV